MTTSTVTITELQNRIKELEEENAKLRDLAYIDELTGCGNRRFFDRALEEVVNLAQRSNTPASVLIIDIDFFKKYNDTFGHQAGDALLSGLGNIWKSSIQRSGDKVFRYGGEEFCAILPNTLKEEASRVVDLINRGASLMGITVSIGIADTTETRDIPTLINKADQRLYQAKRNGRNCAIAN